MAIAHKCITSIPIYQLRDGWHTWFLCDDDCYSFVLNNVNISQRPVDGRLCNIVDAVNVDSTLLDIAQYRIKFIFKLFQRAATFAVQPHNVLFFDPLERKWDIKVHGNVIDGEMRHCDANILIKGVTGKLQSDGNVVFKPILKLQSANPRPMIRAVRRNNVTEKLLIEEEEGSGNIDCNTTLIDPEDE